MVTWPHATCNGWISNLGPYEINDYPRTQSITYMGNVYIVLIVQSFISMLY